MHTALRGLDPEIPEELDLGDWTDGPEVTVITFENLDVPATKAAPAQEGVAALVLDGYTYPLYRDLRKLKYEFVCGVHGPEVTVITFENLDVPATKAAPAQEGVAALVLDGYTYPLYRDLRKLKYEFVCGVHEKAGFNRWVRVVGDKEKAAALEKEVCAMLDEEGWQVKTDEADAADRESD